MPGPVITAPTLPGWVDPKQRSVFDVPGQGILRTIVGLLGLDDPQQVMALGVPLEAGAANVGGLVEAIATKLPRFAKAIKAFHGSPHDFAPEPGAPLGKFKSAQIGTGEGAQAYGHGLYFAEQEATAQAYRDGLSRPTLTHLGQPFPEPVGGRDFLKLSDAQVQDEGARDLLRTAQKSMMYGASTDNVVEYAAGSARVLANKGDKEHWLGVERRIKEMASDLSVNEGKMYEVNIHADPESFLDWDKPLSQQPHAKDAMVKARQSFGQPVLSEATTTGARTGGQEYNMAASREGVGQARVTAALKDAGIPGIKYLDQGSRAAGEGSRNYVVFDETLIDIARKFGLAAALEVYRRKQQAGAPATVQQ